MKYRVIWHDAEDDCTGTSFEVEDDDIKINVVPLVNTMCHYADPINFDGRET